MQKNSKVGGILTIISGSFFLFYLLFTLLAILGTIMIYHGNYGNDFYYGGASEREALRFIVVFYIGTGVVFTLAGILGVIGGIFALKRKYWGLALAGAIAGIFTFFPCGIPAVVFVAMARDEFAGNGDSRVIATPAGPPDISSESG